MNKTIYFLGAGSTSELGMPISSEQVKLFKNLKNIKEYKFLKSLKIICDSYFDSDNYDINDIYNLLDSCLLLHTSLGQGKTIIDKNDIEQCKTELIIYIFNEMLKKINDRDETLYNKLKYFYEELARKELYKKITSNKIDNRDAMIASYSIINLNWDLYSLLPILEAHSNVNHTDKLYYAKNNNPQLRIYTDFNCEYACKDGDKIWYPYTEPAAHVVNNEKYRASRNVVLTKCFYPHGAMNLFKCPYCGKHSYYLGDLTLNSVAKKINYKNFKYHCPYCCEIIKYDDFDVLAQSNFKVRNSYLEEIRLSMMNELRKADKIVFIGYSLPNDDLDYKTLIKSLNNVKEFYVVLYDKKGINKFLSFDELTIDIQERAEVKRIKKILKDKVRFNMAGFPDAIPEILKISD